MTYFKTIERFFEALFEMIGNILLSAIRQVAPFIVPVAPAYFFGRAIYHAAGGGRLALIVGVVAAASLESAGIAAAHQAVKYYADRDERWRQAAVATAVYLVVGVATIWFLESTTTDAKLIGTAMFIIAGLVYFLSGMAESDRQQIQAAQQREIIDIKRQWQLEDEERMHRRDMERQRLQQAHDEKMARIQAKTGSQLPVTSPGSNGYMPGDYRLLTAQQKAQIAQLTSGEIAQAAGVSASTARRWKRKVSDEVNGGTDV